MYDKFNWNYRFSFAIDFIALWGVAPCNLVDDMSVVEEYVT